MIFMRLDKKKILKANFKIFVKKTNITFESFVFDSFEQNDHSKRKNQILVMKAKFMQFDVELSEYLWFEILKTTNYITNRISMTKHRWKTSYELIIDKKSNFFHFHIYDCKAYSLNKKNLKKQKFKKRIHIEFLIEYEICDIFSI
jgi:hypothetical protein